MRIFFTFILFFQATALATPTQPLLDDRTSAPNWTDLTEAEEEAGLKEVSSPMNKALELEYSPMSYSNYEFAPSQKEDKAGNALRLGVEWLPLKTFGKLGIGASASFFVAQDVLTGPESAATLYVFPFEAALSYHLDYIQNQILVPYARIAAEAALVGQGSRSGGVTVGGLQTFYGWNFALGMQLNLNDLDPGAARDLDHAVGINTTYLIAEWVKSNFLDSVRAPDLTYHAYRIGLRFEM